MDSHGDVTLAKKVHIYSNGDKFFTGRRFVINPRQTRNYDSFLTQVTLSLQPSFGAVRVLRTPENGHAVADLSDLETGRSYVACAQKFVKLGYEEITVKPKHVPSPERRNKVIVSGKIRKIDRTPISIFVYTNGQFHSPAKKILLKPWVQKTWETVLVAINEKINLTTGAVRHILDYSTKEEVTEGVHLKNNEYYVAVGSERFKDVEYGIQPTALSPRQQQKRRYPALRPLKNKNKSGNTTDNSQGSSPLNSSNTSSQHDPPPKAKKKNTQQQNNTEEGIPTKPIKHKRGGSDKAKEPAASRPAPAKEVKESTSKKPVEKKKSQPPPATQQPQQPPAAKKTTKNAAPIDLDKASNKADEGGVFKSKGKKQKATEVKEAKNVKEEVPIDKRKADIVEDEELDSRPKKEPLPRIAKNSKNTTDKPSQQPAPKKSVKPASKTAANKEKVLAEKESSPDNGYAEEYNQAATKIQARYKGYSVRKQRKKTEADPEQTKDEEKSVKDKPESEEVDKEEAAIKIQAGYKGYKVRQDIKKRNEAATTIQAGYRGHVARKEVKKLKGSDENATKPENGNEAGAPTSQTNTDAEMVNAAIKIQANFRGYQSRKSVKTKG